jgi:hypothetical protein
MTLNTSKNHQLSTAFMLALLALSVSLGGAIAAYEPRAAIFGMSFVFLSIFFLSLIKSRTDYSGIIFVISFILFFILPFIQKITGLPLFGLWQLLLIFSIFGISKFSKYVPRAHFLLSGLATFFVFLSLGAFSTFTTKYHLWAASYQLVSDLKPILLLISGFAITWSSLPEKWFWKIIEWFWLPTLLLIIFEWIAPGAYFSIFKGATSADPTHMFPSRAVGTFQGPTFLAAIAAMFALLSFSRSQNYSTTKKYDRLRVAIYLAIILFAVQRQELIGAILALILIFILDKPKQAFNRSIVALLILISTAPIFWTLFSQNILQEAALWGVGTIRPIEHPRAELYQGAYFLATQYFPFGSGLGSYGGAGADKFNHTLYFQLGFSRYWWFGKENYLMDTYWPNSIAETGFFGALSLLATYVFFLLHAVKKSISTLSHARIYWLFCSGGMFYLLTLSLTSPAFQDPILSFLPLLAFGIAHNAEIQYEKPCT